MLRKMMVATITVGAVAAPLAMKRYRDAETGVVLRYPAGWSAGAAGGYFGHPLLTLPQALQTADKVADEARFSVGWNSGQTEGANRSVMVTYAVLTAKDADACRLRVTKQDDPDAKPDVKIISGRAFDHVRITDAGMSKAMVADLYSAWVEGRCLGFEAMQLEVHANGEPRLRQSYSDARAAMYAVVRTAVIPK